MILVHIPTIKGDSQVKDHPNWISVEDFSFGVEREFAESGKAGTADINLGVGDLKECSMSKGFDCSSADLMQHAVAGNSVGTVEVHFIETEGVEGEGKVYLAYKLENTFIKSWEQSGSADDRPSDTFSLWYYKISLTYWSTTDGKTYKQWGPKGWDRITNKAWDVK